MSNDYHAPSHHPKPPSPSAVLKILRAAGEGTRIEIQPEHLAALDAAIAALSFQQQVQQLLQHVPLRPEHMTHAAVGDHKESRDHRNARGPRDSRAFRIPHDERSAVDAVPRVKALPRRPTEGSGSIWTSDEELRLRAQWDQGDAIGAIAEQHKRSPLACFARLVRIGGLPPSSPSEAAIFLIKKHQLVQQKNAHTWLAHAESFGFEAHLAGSQPVSASPKSLLPKTKISF